MRSAERAESSEAGARHWMVRSEVIHSEVYWGVDVSNINHENLFRPKTSGQNEGGQNTSCKIRVWVDNTEQMNY